MLSMTLDARELYEARNYAGVVKLLADTPRELLVARPEQGFMLADAARRVGGVPDVVELIAEVVEAARAQDENTVLCNALNLQGVLLLEAGRAHAAERAWCDLVIIATEVDSPDFVARASNNLGVAAILSMRLDDAIASFNRSVSAYLRLGYARGLAQSHQNLGIVFRELDQERESLAAFERAMMWANTAECTDDVARAEQELALLLLYSYKDADSAFATAGHALAKFTELGQPAGRGEALRVIGVVEIARGNFDAAEAALSESLGIARTCKLRLLEGEVLLAQAAIPRAEPEQKQKLFKQAREIFTDIGAAAWGEQVRRRMEEL
jgi:tetratricopeptide (TPR) repeat protein